MKRFMLVPESQASSRLTPDLRQKLYSYQEAKQENFNIPPHIRPQPLVKYEARKWSQVIDTNPTPNLNESPQGKGVGRQVPNYAIAKANKISPFLSVIQARLPPGFETAALLTDLVTRRKTKESPPVILKMAVRMLLKQTGFLSSWLDPALLTRFKTPPRPKSVSSVKRKPATPKKRQRLLQTSEDEDTARQTQQAYTARSGAVPTTLPTTNSWLTDVSAQSIQKQPAWASTGDV